MRIFFNLKINFVFILIFIGTDLKGQGNLINQAFEFPTKEVYNLHIDKHGFLWVASDFGVARYDGINCINFTSPLQISLGCTNLLEDNYGRIWFNNFNGQIFYIDHETVYLVKSYDSKKETNFPRMALFHDQLLATSDRGLFVLDTKTLIGHYITCQKNNKTYTSSLAVLKDRVVVYGNKKWYVYKPTSGLKKIAFVGDSQINGNIYTLNQKTFKDTIYVMANPSGLVQKLFISNDTVQQKQKMLFNTFVNTISIEPDNQWVNTHKYSYSLKTGETIKGYNISDIVTDFEGNTWFSSLYHGLLIRYKEDITSKTTIPLLDTDDLVISIKNYNGKLLLGTQGGFLIMYDPASKSTSFKIKIPGTPGSINSITTINNDECIIAGSIATYKFNISTKKITEFVHIKSVKQLSYNNNAIYIAASSGLFIIPTNKTGALKNELTTKFGNTLKYNLADGYFSLRTRCRAVCYFPDQKSLFVAFKDGLFKIDKNGISPFIFDGTQVYAASIACVNHQLYIGTISNGLLEVDRNGIKHFSIQNGLSSKSIFKIKSSDKNLWIIGSGPLQLFDTQKKIFLENYVFPSRNASQVFDLDQINQKVYLATPLGLDYFPLIETSANKKLQNYLLFVRVNNQIVTAKNNLKLSYTENNIAFNIGVPSYLKAKDIYTKYCLVTATDSDWQATEPGERIIRFSPLMPGKYTLKAIAVDPRLGTAATMIKYNFTIEGPWWSGLGFKIIFGIAFFMIIFYGYVTMLIKRLSLKKAFDEQQQLILTERQRISAEIHDDIGSGIFAIHLFADLASKKADAGDEIRQIKFMIIELSEKIKEVIWSTNFENDNLESLLYYTHFQISKLFEHSTVNFISIIPDDIIDLNINAQSRRNIFLTVKELIHNAIKHSKATKIELKMFTDEQMLYIYVDDNGVGINLSKASANGMGLANVKSRIKKLNGALTIENNEGTHISIEIPLSEMLVIGFDKKLKNWQLFVSSLLKISFKKSNTTK